MFIVKAVQDGDTKDSPYTTYTCDYYHVTNVGGASSNKNDVFAQKQVDLMEAHPTDKMLQGDMTATLEVGPGIDHFHAVYIMNDRGKTIDKISAVLAVPTHPVVRCMD